MQQPAPGLGKKTRPKGSERPERRAAFRKDVSRAVNRRETIVTAREGAVLTREKAVRLREAVVDRREEAARVSEETARLREETVRAREEAASVKAEVQQYVLQLRDVNQRLVVASLRAQALTEQADHANRLKDDFLATVSHELRTPLTAVAGWARALRLNRVSADRVGHAIQAIEHNAAHLAQLIEDLLDVSRIASGTLQIESQPVNLAAVIDAAIETVRPAADAKGLDLIASDTPSTEPIMGDRRRLQQVVSNLLSNAIKFTPRGGRVDIGVRRVDANLELRVSDTGRGISPDFLPLMFERFRQADQAPSRREGGLGLGLAIVRQIVELHGGSVRADSSGIDRGTTVTVGIPLVRERGDGSVPGVGTYEGLYPEHVQALDVADHADDRAAAIAEGFQTCLARRLSQAFATPHRSG